MAIIKTPADFNRTGQNGFMRASNFLSHIPFVGPVLSVPLGWIGAGIDGAKWAFRGKFKSAITAFGVGGISATVNGAAGGFGNIASTIVTGKSMGKLVGGFTEKAVGGVADLTKPIPIIGGRPTVLKSEFATIGSLNPPQQGPGQYATMVSQQRGVDPNQAYARYMSGEGGVHVNQLQSANLSR